MERRRERKKLPSSVSGIELRDGGLELEMSEILGVLS
jgi:hypothetical protein